MLVEIPAGTKIVELEIDKGILGAIDADTTVEYGASLAELAHDDRPEAGIVALKLAKQAGVPEAAALEESGDPFIINIKSIIDCTRRSRSRTQTPKHIATLFLRTEQ